MTNRLYISNADVNSGSPTILLGASFNYQWANMVNEFPIPGKFDGIIGTNFKGWKNPIISVTFYIEWSLSNGTITWRQWNDFVKASSSPTYLQLVFGTTDDKFVSYANVAFNNTYLVDKIKIQIKDYTVQVDPNKINRLYVTFTAVETL